MFLVKSQDILNIYIYIYIYICVCVCIPCALLYTPPERPPVPAPPEPAPPERSPEHTLPERFPEGNVPNIFLGGGYILLVWITIVAIVKTLDDATIAPVSKPSQNIIWPWLPSLQSHHGSLNPQIHHDLPSLLSHLGRQSPQTHHGSRNPRPALEAFPMSLPWTSL